jgi:hypothetical protein
MLIGGLQSEPVKPTLKTVGNGFIVTDALLDDWQVLPFVTVIESETEPDAPAVYVMLRVPVPAVIVPPLIIHAYDEPEPAFGTEAVLPVELEQTEVAAVIVASGKAFIVTDALDVAEHELEFVTLTERVIVPEPPAVYVTLLVPVPAVMDPLVIFHEYIAPTPASGTDAEFPVELAHAAVGVVIVALGDGLIVTVAFEDAEQPLLLVTVIARVTEPDAPAVNVIFLVPVPAVIEPLVIVHAYAELAPASGTDAELPVELEHTEDGAVIEALGGGFIVTVVLEDAEQPLLFVTVMATVTVPDVPAVYAILLVPAPVVIVPLVTLHEYVAPVPAFGMDAALPVELEQTELAVVIVASGNALMVTDALDDAEHEFEFVTVAEIVIVPDASALYVILFVPVPAVIEPFVTLHE